MKSIAIVAAALLVACVAASNDNEPCPAHSCIEASKCSAQTVSNKCELNSDVCCSDIKSEDRYRCSHFLGECMNGCNAQVRVPLQTDECQAKQQVCCVLV